MASTDPSGAACQTLLSLADLGSLRERSLGPPSTHTPGQTLADAYIEQAALESVQALLCRLQLPTLKQALADLGLPIEGKRGELTARLTDAMSTMGRRT